MNEPETENSNQEKSKQDEKENQGFETYQGRLGCGIFLLFILTIPLTKCGTSVGAQVVGPSFSDKAVVEKIDAGWTDKKNGSSGVPNTRHNDIFLKTSDGREHKFTSASAIHFVEVGQEVEASRSRWNGKIQALIIDERSHPVHLFNRILIYLLLGIFMLIVGAMGYFFLTHSNEGERPPPARKLITPIVILLVISLAGFLGFLWETRGMKHMRNQRDDTSSRYLEPAQSNQMAKAAQPPE